MVLRKIAAALGGLAALAVSACEEAPRTVVHFTRGGPNIWSYFVYAIKDGPMWVDVRGTPFAGADPGRVARAVEAGMKAGVTRRIVEFTTERARAAHPEHRVILVFSPPSDFGGNRACEGTVPEPGPALADAVQVMAVYCTDGERRAAVSGAVKKIASPDDRKFHELLRQVAYDMFERDSPGG